MLFLLLWQLLLGHGQGIVHPKVIDNDGHRHCNGEHPSQCTESPHHHARPGLGVHITVAQRCHRDHSPPEPNGDVLKVSRVTPTGVGCLSSDSLSIVDHGGKNQDPQGKEDDEEQEFIGASPERVAQHPEAHKVPCQLEDPEDPNETDHPQEAQHIPGSFGGQATKTYLQVEGQYGHKVNDVEQVFNEEKLIWTADDPNQELEGEPQDADPFDVGEDGLRLHLMR